MKLFNCTNSILDEEFQAVVQNLAEIWGASTYQAQRFPVSFPLSVWFAELYCALKFPEYAVLALVTTGRGLVSMAESALL
jgi:hypothetical protein